MIWWVGPTRYGHICDAVSVDISLLERFTQAAEVDRSNRGPMGRWPVELWIDDWWMIGRLLAAAPNTLPGTARNRQEMRRGGRLLIGHLSKLAGHAAYRGYAMIGERMTVHDAWAPDGGGRFWAGQHQLDEPGKPVYLVPRIELFNGKPITRWFPRPAADQAWRIDA
jgi:hypothetical protein